MSEKKQIRKSDIDIIVDAIENAASPNEALLKAKASYDAFKEGEKKKVLANVTRTIKSNKTSGGQHTNGPESTTVILESSDFDIKISVGHYRSQIKNYELGMTLMELALDEVIK